jgi:hypothetical protein
MHIATNPQKPAVRMSLGFEAVFMDGGDVWQGRQTIPSS